MHGLNSLQIIGIQQAKMNNNFRDEKEKFLKNKPRFGSIKSVGFVQLICFIKIL
jgi:hypothetical protein